MRDLTAVTIALAILALGFLIVVHEAGHYFVAKWCRMRVERFSIGFGPGILKRKGKDGTIFQIAPIPFGGFVEIRGMNIAEEVDPEDAFAYPNRPVWQRFLTILAGPATNYLAAIVLAVFLFQCHGATDTETQYIDEIAKDSAAEGKLQHGDRIVAIDRVHMYGPKAAALAEAVNAKKGKPLLLTVLRDGAMVDIEITPKLKLIDAKGEKCEAKAEGCGVYQLGVIQTHGIITFDFWEANYRAMKYPVEQTALILGGFRDIFTGKEKADLGGPIRIVGEFKKAFEAGWVYGIRLVMMLSVYLGLFNLFPLPALDGGRLVFLGYEMITRRRANPKIETMVHMGGIMVLMVLMLLVLVIDIRWLF